MAIKNQKIVADFETTTDPNDVRVWAVCAVDIETAETVFISNSLDEFLDWLSTKNTICYFHNLRFDLEFILPNILIKRGFKHSDSHEAGTFETLISDTGVFYSCTLYFSKENKKYRKVVFYDSLKKLPFKVSQISRAFELEDKKLAIDYNAYRAPGHELTDEEKRYIVNDCRIVAQALKIQMDEGLQKMTNASDAMAEFKRIIGKEQFASLFPEFPLELDADIRRAYKGGYVYLKPDHQNERGLQGKQYDVNSLYPSVMYDCLLPYGYPLYFEGEPDPPERYPLYIVRLRCAFEIKPGHLPTIQLKGNYKFMATEYLTSSRDKTGLLCIEELTLTNVDLALFLEHYDVLNLEYIKGWYFKGTVGIFKDYIDHWMKIKETNTGAKRQLAKLMLNSLYGKFATNPRGGKRIPYVDEEGIIRYMSDPDAETRTPVYTAMGCFITAYAREKTIRSAQANFDRFIYADTDSLKILGFEPVIGLDIHPSRLGAWKDEGDFEDSKFLRAKTYMMTVQDVKKDSLRNYAVILSASTTVWVRRESDGIHYASIKVTCAGMPDNVKEAVTYENFTPGAVFTGKLVPRRYPGGIVLEDTTFTIK